MAPMGPPEKVRTELKTERKVRLGEYIKRHGAKNQAWSMDERGLKEIKRERRRGRERKLSNCQVVRTR
jgi:hypothetical protein